MTSFDLIYCTRNDNYSDQNSRIKRFIDYYANLEQSLPAINFNFIVVEWNPQEGEPSIAESFPWERLHSVNHIVVDACVHNSYPNPTNRCILDYAGRNVGLEASCSDYSVILNQDVYIDKFVFELVATSRRTDVFYRANRTDFSELDGKQIVKTIHERLNNNTLDVLKRSDGSYRFFENSNDNEIEQRFPAHSLIYKLSWLSCKLFNLFLGQTTKIRKLDLLMLHMNASGDFLIVPNISNSNIRYPETAKFYMHTDGYILVRLECAGFRQIIIKRQSCVLHLDHSRPDRSSDVSYHNHFNKFEEILNESI